MSAKSGTFAVASGNTLPELGTAEKLAGSKNTAGMFGTAAPNSILYNDIKNQPTVENRIVSFAALNSQTFQPSDVSMSFDITGKDLLDFTLPHGFLAFQAWCSASDSSLVCFQNCIWNIFSAIKVSLKDGTVLSYQTQKNLIESLSYTCAHANNFDATVGIATCGIADFATRQTWAPLAAAKTYTMPLPIPLFNSQQQIMANIQGYTIEFFFASGRQCMNADVLTSGAATYDYRVLNPKIYCRSAKYTGGEMSDMFAAVNPVSYPYIDYKIFPSQLAVGQMIADVLIPVKLQSCLRAVAFIVPNTDINNPVKTDRFTTNFQKSGTTTYQLQVGDDYWPRIPIDCGLQAYLECLQNMDRAEVGTMDLALLSNNGSVPLFNIDCFQIDLQGHLTNKHLMTLDMRACRDNDPSFLNVLDSTPGNVQLTFKLNMATGYPLVASTLFIVVYHGAVAQVYTNGTGRLVY
jgi:hypothetical protein